MLAGVKTKFSKAVLTGNLLHNLTTLRTFDLIGKCHLRSMVVLCMKAVILLHITFLVAVELIGKVQVSDSCTVLFGIIGILRSKDVLIVLIEFH